MIKKEALKIILDNLNKFEYTGPINSLSFKNIELILSEGATGGHNWTVEVGTAKVFIISGRVVSDIDMRYIEAEAEYGNKIELIVAKAINELKK